MYGQIWRLVPNACSPLPPIRAGAGRGSWPAGRPAPLRRPALASAATRSICRPLAVSAQPANLDTSLRLGKFFEVEMKVRDYELTSMELSIMLSMLATANMSGDKFVVKVRLASIKGIRMIFEHCIEKLPNHELIVEAKATAVCLNKDYRPTRVSPEFLSRLQLFSSVDNSG